MERLLEQLIDVLHQTISVYQNLLPVIQNEKAAAIASQYEELIAHTSEKEELLARLTPVERQREQLLDLIGQTLPAAQKALTLTQLAAHVQPPYDQRLRDVQKALARVIESVQQANTESRLIFAHCRKWTRNTLGFFEHWMKSTELYGATGSLRNQTGNGRLVSGNV